MLTCADYAAGGVDTSIDCVARDNREVAAVECESYYRVSGEWGRCMPAAGAAGRRRQRRARGGG